MQLEKYVWLFGENVGKTANNNSFFFWDQIVIPAKEDGISAFFVLERNAKNKAFVASLPREKRSMVVWKDGGKHYLLYNRADMLFVTLSYRDVVPDAFLHVKIKRYAEAPVVYLQHGVLGMKAISYGAHTYNNNLFRFIYYNRNIREKLIDVNKMRPYQLFYGQYQPRYKELVTKAKRFDARRAHGKRILWFATWRESKLESTDSRLFMAEVRAVLKSKKLHQYLEESNTSLTVIVHQLADEGIAKELDLDKLPASIQIEPAFNVDVMDLIAESDALITDYSSVAFDFSFLGKPVVLYQPDFEQYASVRKFYCDLETLRLISYRTPAALIDAIADGSAFEHNDFFRSAFPETIDFDYVSNGGHIDRMYRYFLAVQRHTITFLGYGFWGVGGTVTATKALAESLLECGYAVKLLSLKKLQSKAPANNPPAGLQFSAFYNSAKTQGKSELPKRLLWRRRSHYGLIRRDKDVDNLIPYAGWALKRYLRQTNSSVLVSTRESLHHAVKEANDAVEKIFFFHTTANALEDYFPGLAAEMADEGYGKALFTTSTNRRLTKQLGIRVEVPVVIGNTLESKNMKSLDEAMEWRQSQSNRIGPFQYIDCVTLLRFSEGREKDIDNIIDFGKYLKNRGIVNVRVLAYGGGRLLESFIERVIAEDLLDIILVKGATTRPVAVISEANLVIDFAEEQSFGMTYLEATLNGVIPLCKENSGSSEVFKGCEFLFYKSWDELYEKIGQFRNCDDDVFELIYKKVYERYSHEAVSSRFLDLAFDGNPLRLAENGE